MLPDRERASTPSNKQASAAADTSGYGPAYGNDEMRGGAAPYAATVTFHLSLASL